jgi:hypothetical protein
LASKYFLLHETKDLRIWNGRNAVCVIAPVSNGDGVVNFLDFVVVAEHWLEKVVP